MREGLGVCPRAVGRSACESMNSHTPSDATMMKRSPSASGSLAGAAPRSNRLISGSGMTPKRLHSPSPMERDIAKPTRPSAHTRGRGAARARDDAARADDALVLLGRVRLAVDREVPRPDRSVSHVAEHSSRVARACRPDGCPLHVDDDRCVRTSVQTRPRGEPRQLGRPRTPCLKAARKGSHGAQGRSAGAARGWLACRIRQPSRRCRRARQRRTAAPRCTSR